MRALVLIITVLALLSFTLWEVGVSYPVPWWRYAGVCAAFAAVVLRPVPLNRQIGRLGAIALFFFVSATLHFVPWSTRKPFLNDFNRIEIGMDETEVRQIMSRYIEGTGWPSIPGSLSNSAGTMRIAASPSTFSTRIYPAGEIVLADSLVFRHANDGDFGSDWAIVTLSNGRVVRAEFSPD